MNREFVKLGALCSWWWSALSLLAAVTLLRVAGFLFGILDVDECDFALFGRLVLRGARPYLDVVDNKPPGVYAFYGLASLFGGDRWLFASRVLGVLAVWATALLLGAAATVASGDERQGRAAAWLAVAAGLCDVPAVSAEVVMNLPTAAALWLLAKAHGRGRTWLYTAAGAAAALAPMCKQQAVVVPLALAAGLLWELRRGRDRRHLTRRRLAAFTLGVVGPWSLLAVVLSAAGSLAAAYGWIVTRGMAQLAGGSAPTPAHLLTHATTLTLGVCLPLLLALVGARRWSGPLHGALVALLLLGGVMVFAGGRLYEHYGLQLVPPLALLGAPALVILVERWPSLHPARRVAVVLAGVLPVLGFLSFTVGRGLAGGYAGQEYAVRAAAGWLASHSAESDRVFVWGDRSTIYCASGRLPGTRYLRAAVHVGDIDPELVRDGFVPRVASEDVAATLEDLEKHHTAFVLDTSPADLHRWARFPLATIPVLEAYVERHYRLVAHPAGTSVYRRIDAGDARLR